MLVKRVLPLDFERAAVKRAIFVEITAKFSKIFPWIADGVKTRRAEEFDVADPVYKVVFIPKVIVKAFAVHFAGVADVKDADFFNRCVFHELF